MEQMRIKDIIDSASFINLLKVVRSTMGKDAEDHYLLWDDLSEDQLGEMSMDIYYKLYKRYPIEYLKVLHEESLNIIGDISSIIVSRFGANFKSVYDAYFKTPYKPLENYSMHEKRTPNLTNTATTESKIITEGESGEYGFNSSESVPSTTSKTTSTADADENITTTTATGTEDLERAGNIGTLTTQRMMSEEIELRKFDYWNMVYDSISGWMCRGLL